MKEHLLAEEEATKNLRRKMETLRTQKSSSPPPPHPYQQGRQEKDLSQKPNRQKDLDPGRSRGVVSRELLETPTSAILPEGKVEKAILPGGKVDKVEDQPSASRGKRPTWQNAATSNDGTASQAPLTREKLTAETEKLTGETEEKQKFTPRQNIGAGLDPGKSQNVRADNGSTHNGMSKAALIEKSKHEPSKSHQPPAAKDKPETKTAPWRQGRSSQQVEEKVEKKVSKSKREEQEKKVQEFLRDPSAPAGSTVPLEVRLRKPGKMRDEFANLFVCKHAFLSVIYKLNAIDFIDQSQAFPQVRD